MLPTSIYFRQFLQMEFMIETICDIKNNKKRSKEDTVPHARIKKWLQKVYCSRLTTIVCLMIVAFFLIGRQHKFYVTDDLHLHPKDAVEDNAVSVIIYLIIYFTC